MNKEEQILFDRKEKLYPALNELYQECSGGNNLEMVWRGGIQITLNMPGTSQDGIKFAGDLAELIGDGRGAQFNKSTEERS